MLGNTRKYLSGTRNTEFAVQRERERGRRLKLFEKVLAVDAVGY